MGIKAAEIVLMAQQTIELIIFSPDEMAQPTSRLFDGPVSLALASLIQGPTEEVPGFTSISQHGVNPQMHRLLQRQRQARRAAGQLHGDRTLAHRLEAAGA
jgi:hypothetical protein